MNIKLVGLFTNQVVERKNMILSIYLRGRACIESVRGLISGGVLSFSILGFSLVLSFSYSFCGFATFRAFYWLL
jgi:hypothetical protein